MLFPWKSIEASAQDVFNRWFAYSKEEPQCILNFFEAFCHSSIPHKYQLISGVSAIEMFVQAIFDLGDVATYPENEAAFEERAIKESMGRASIIEMSLGGRLHAAFSQLSGDLQQRIVGDSVTFIRDIVLTRNIILHGDSGRNGPPMQGIQLYKASEKLKIVFMALLFNKLGLASERVREALPTNNRIRWAMDG